jgi:hypothetical protein
MPATCRRDGFDSPNSVQRQGRDEDVALQEKNGAQGKPPATRAGMRLDIGPPGEIFALNKRDGIVRMIVP